MQIRKLMAVLFAVVLMAGILPTRIFAESTDPNITISSHTTGQLYHEIPDAAKGLSGPITGITVADGTMDSTDWFSLNDAITKSKNVTKVDLSGTSFTGSTPDYIFNNDSSLKTVILPSDLTSIGCGEFNGCSGLTSITIPGTVTSIGSSAFSGCTGLTTITIPALVTSSIGNNTFSGCTNLSSVNILGSIASIGKYAFNGCSNLTTITISESTTSIDDCAFKDCINLPSITIPQSVTSIGNEAFSGCTKLYPVTFSGTPKTAQIGNFAFANDTNLTKINIPASVTSIGYDAFSGCANLSDVTVNSSTPITIGSDAFIGTANNAIIHVPAGSEADWDKSDGSIDHDLRITSTRLKIENLPPLLRYRVFRVSDSEANIMITSDEDGVFYYAVATAGASAPTIDTSKDGKTLNNGPIHLTDLSAGAYKLYVIAEDLHKNKMASPEVVNIEVYFPPVDLTITNHADGSFSNELKNAMSSAGIPMIPNMNYHYDLIKNLTVSGGAFNDADWQALFNTVSKDENNNIVNMVHVQTVDLSGVSSTSSVPNGTFQNCISLSHVVLPSGITGLGREAFSYCISLTSITIPGNVSSIGGRAFEGCESLASITIPNSVTSIGGDAFESCSDLTSITIPNSVTSIGSDAFSDCSSLASITIPSSISSVASGTFGGCSSLASITIPSSVTSIDDSAFAGCSTLASITSLAATPPVLEDGGSDFFSGLPSTGTLNVPSGSTAAYTSAWGSYLPAHWTITAAGSPTPYGDGFSGGNSAYNANVSGSGSQTSLPVTVDDGSKTASFDLGSQSFSQTETVITVPSIPNVHTYSAKISVSDLSGGAAQGTLTVKTCNGSITVPSNMLTSGTSGSKASISIGQGDKTALPASGQAALGSHPLLQLSMAIDGKQTEWNNPNALVTVSIPYTPTAAELNNPDSIVIWYIDGSGKAVCVPSGHYNAATGTVTFTTTHFSLYAVGVNNVSFSDVSSSTWYYDAISFLAARGITTGTGNGAFSPDSALTRGQFLVMLLRAYGISADENPSSNFADAGNTYYTNYLAAAKRLGISNGVGNNLFAPEKAITRQEMFTLLYNALKTLNQLPKGTSGKTLSSFSDSGESASWATDALKLFVETGTISGSRGKLAPTNTTTRAEMAQMLYKLMGK